MEQLSYKELSIGDKVKIKCTKNDCLEIGLEHNYDEYIGNILKIYKDKIIVSFVNDVVMFPISSVKKVKYNTTIAMYEDWLNTPECDELAEAYVRDANKHN